MTPTVIWCRHPIVTLLYFVPLWVISRYLLLMAIWSHFWRYVISVSHYVVNCFDWCGRSYCDHIMSTSRELDTFKVAQAQSSFENKKDDAYISLSKDLMTHWWGLYLSKESVIYFVRGLDITFQTLEVKWWKLERWEVSTARAVHQRCDSKSINSRWHASQDVEWIGPKSRSLAFELYSENHLEWHKASTHNWFIVRLILRVYQYYLRLDTGLKRLVWRIKSRRSYILWYSILFDTGIGLVKVWICIVMQGFIINSHFSRVTKDI